MVIAQEIFLSLVNAMCGRTNKLACHLLNSVSALERRKAVPGAGPWRQRFKPRNNPVENIYMENPDFYVGFYSSSRVTYFTSTFIDLLRKGYLQERFLNY